MFGGSVYMDRARPFTCLNFETELLTSSLSVTLDIIASVCPLVERIVLHWFGAVCSCMCTTLEAVFWG